MLVNNLWVTLFFNKAELICLHTVKWFKLSLFNQNNHINDLYAQSRIVCRKVFVLWNTTYSHFCLECLNNKRFDKKLYPMFSIFLVQYLTRWYLWFMRKWAFYRELLKVYLLRSCKCFSTNRFSINFGWLVGWFVGFYGISAFVGYLTPDPFLCK